jgi:dihydrofolate reductase
MCEKHNEVFVIGGQSVYEQAVPYADRMYITEVYAEFDGDAFFPEFDATEWDRVPPVISTADQELGFEYCFAEYRRK